MQKRFKTAQQESVTSVLVLARFIYTTPQNYTEKTSTNFIESTETWAQDIICVWHEGQSFAFWSWKPGGLLSVEKLHSSKPLIWLLIDFGCKQQIKSQRLNLSAVTSLEQKVSQKYCMKKENQRGFLCFCCKWIAQDWLGKMWTSQVHLFIKVSNAASKGGNIAVRQFAELEYLIAISVLGYNDASGVSCLVISAAFFHSHGVS